MKKPYFLMAALAATLSFSQISISAPVKQDIQKANISEFYNVKPAIKSLGIKNPTRGLFVGNSYTYYNCGIGAYVKGFVNKKAGEEWKARMQTISAGRLYRKERLSENPRLQSLG